MGAPYIYDFSRLSVKLVVHHVTGRLSKVKRFAVSIFELSARVQTVIHISLAAEALSRDKLRSVDIQIQLHAYLFF